MVFELLFVFLIKLENILVAFDLRKVILRLIRRIHYLNDLHDNLKYLKVGPPILLHQIFEKDFILSIALSILLNVNVHYFVMEEAF